MLLSQYEWLWPLHPVSPRCIVQTFHRSQLLNALVNHLRTPDEVLHLRKRLASYEEPVSPSDPVVMRFTDGTSATCDLLIGSDGIRSAVRRSMYTSFADEADGESAEELRSMIEPVWSGSVAYRGLAKGDKLPEDIRQYVSMSPGIVSYFFRVAQVTIF